jgi:SagB-type dehydrogenase family enzyme
MPGASFSTVPMPLAQLGSMLAFSYGVTHSKKIAGSDEEHLFRATTSAGGLYPLEIYPVVFNVGGLEPGIYHYRVPDHCLEVVRKGAFLPQFLKATSSPDLAERASVVYVVTAVLQRNLFKYQHRGYRFIMNDAGALIQSLYITGTALGLGTCALGGFFDDEMGKLIGVNNVDEIVVICFLAGSMKRATGNGKLQK